MTSLDASRDDDDDVVVVVPDLRVDAPCPFAKASE